MAVTPQLREDTWHLYWRFRGRQRSRSTKIKHNGKFKNGKAVPPVEVIRALHRLEMELEAGRDARSETVTQLLDRVSEQYATNGFRSVDALRSRRKHLEDVFGNLRAEHIAKADILDYQARRKKQGAANNTVNNELQLLFKAMRLIDIPVPNEWKELMLKRPPARAGFFDDSLIENVLRHLPLYLRKPVLCGYMIGWRKEEIFSRMITDVDLERGELRLWRSKTDLARCFPIDVVPGLRELLEEAIQEGRPDPKARVPEVQPWLFIHKRGKRNGGHMRRIVEFRKAWRTACHAAGCPRMHFHDLRRSTARNLEAMGWPRSLIMQWCGWETESMFHRYRIVSAADRTMVTARIQALREIAAGGTADRDRLMPALESAAQRSLANPALVGKVLAMPKKGGGT
jgi:integrase